MRLVMKFGGTSLSDGKRVRRVAELVKSYAKNRVVVACSAADGVTDELVELAEAAKRGAEGTVEDGIHAIKSRHMRILQVAIGKPKVKSAALKYVEETLSQLEKSARGVAVLRELTPRSRDVILSCGERLSAPIVWGALSQAGLDAAYFTGGEAGILTDDNFGDAQPLMEATKLQVKETLGPLLESGKTPVVTGYIGTSQSGELTTLGRGGSDFTATIIAAALDADEAWIWSDVDGLMTADPRVVHDAKVLREISYSEAAEMAVFGAKALHPRTLEPVAEKGIPVRFRNTFNPKNAGTLVRGKVRIDKRRVVKSVALVRDVAAITVSGASMVGKPGSAAEIFGVLARTGTNILMISQSVSESNISLVVKRSAVLRSVNALELAFLGESGLRKVVSEDDVNVVAVIGGGMRGIHGVASRVFGAVASRGINVRMIAQGSSEQNISFVVGEKDGTEAVRVIHSAFGLGKSA